MLSSLWLAGAACSVSMLVTVLNALIAEGQFFPACVYLLKSQVVAVFALYAMFLAAYAMKNVLFGDLRLIESEEYGWMTLSESFLAMTIFREELDAIFIFVFTSVFFAKGLHWICRDRVDFMEQTAHLPRNFALRVMSALVFLATVDFIGLSICIRRIVESGPSMAILFANEVGSLNSPSPSTRPPLTKAPSKGPSQRHSSSKRACLTRLRSQKFALMIVTLLSTGTRFILNLKDIQGEAPWEHRSVFLFYFEFLIDSLKLIVYSIFFATVVIYYGIPLHIIRDLYLTVHSFVTRIRDIIRYRRATANMHEQYADATEEDLASTDRICIICREEMATSIKKLACGHLFHFNCLRSWLERQQTCPTCRSAIAPPPNGNEDGRNPDPPNQHHQMANGDAGEGEVVGARQRRSLDGGLAAAMRRGQVRQRSLPPNGAPVEEASVRGRHYTAYSTYPGNYEASPVAPPIIFVRPDQIVMEGDEGGTDAIYRLKSAREGSEASPPSILLEAVRDFSHPILGERSASPTYGWEGRGEMIGSMSSSLSSTISQARTMETLPERRAFIPATRSHSPSGALLDSVKSGDERYDDEGQSSNISSLRSSIRQQLQDEMQSLSRLQTKVAALTERLVLADAELEAIESIGEDGGGSSGLGKQGESSPLLGGERLSNSSSRVASPSPSGKEEGLTGTADGKENLRLSPSLKGDAFE